MAKLPRRTVPTSAWKRYLAALVEHERDHAYQALNSLQHWLDLGGGPPAGFTRREIAALVEILLERERTAARIRQEKAHQRQQRRYLGGKVPFGWRRDNGGLIEVPAEQDAIALMLTAHEQNLSLSEIADRVAARGISLAPSVIWRIIQRAKKERS
jgi:putative DNA-invertase from lambdoid prophage Rac